MLRRRLLVFGLFSVGVSPVARGVVGTSANGVCGIREAYHAVGALMPGSDDDHDGQTNRSQSLAGTDPLDAADSFRVGSPESAAGATLLLPNLPRIRDPFASSTANPGFL